MISTARVLSSVKTAYYKFVLQRLGNIKGEIVNIASRVRFENYGQFFTHADIVSKTGLRVAIAEKLVGFVPSSGLIWVTLQGNERFEGRQILAELEMRSRVFDFYTYYVTGLTCNQRQYFFEKPIILPASSF